MEAEFEASPAAEQDHENQDAKIDMEANECPCEPFFFIITCHGSTAEEERELESSSIANMMTLEDHLFQQLYWEISDPEKRKIGDFIIGNLDKDGYLHLSCEEIAENLNISDISAVKEVLNSIQNFDPLGIATQNLTAECLIVQLQNRPITLSWIWRYVS